MDKKQQRTIGKYKILGTLGRGAMGVVYRAEDPEIGRTVAIKTLRKILPEGLRGEGAALERFKVEARSAGNLRHPNIITVFDASIEGDVPYIVMDYVEGENLAGVLSRYRRLNPQIAMFYLSQIAEGLDYAHSRGVLHRDIKPANILIDRSNQVYLLDFGVASISQSYQDGSVENQESLVMGTPGYMSPEQILNNPLDHRSDLFGFAVVCFECLAGQRPFPGSTFAEVIENILKKNPISITGVVPDFSLSLESEFEKALSQNPQDRFETAIAMVRAFCHALGVAEQQLTGGPRSVGIERPRKYSAWKVVGQKDKPAEGASAAIRRGQTKSQKGEQADVSPGVTSGKVSYPPPHRPQRAGDMFSHRDEAIRGRAHLESAPRKWVRVVLWSLALICLVSGGGILIKILDKNKLPVIVKDAGPGSGNLIQPGTENNPDAPVSPIVVENLPPVPGDKAVEEMSGEELIAVLVSSDVAEPLILDALSEASSRKLSSVPAAVLPLLRHDSYVVRLRSVEALEKTGDIRIIPEILNLLDDYDPLVRSRTAKALGNIGNRRVLGYLQAKLVEENDKRVRAAIQQAIDAIEGKG